jgi:molybdopterin/thiamine biosynthesis adenylyltransferase
VLELIVQYDLVIDATDNIPTRYIINDACVILGKPFVYGAIHLFEGHVSVFNYKDGPTYRCLYPDYPSAAEVPDCNTIGVLRRSAWNYRLRTGFGSRESINRYR